MQMNIHADLKLDLLLGLIHAFFAEEPDLGSERAQDRMLKYLHQHRDAIDEDFLQSIEPYEGQDLIRDFLNWKIGGDIGLLQAVLSILERIQDRVDWGTFWYENIEPTYRSPVEELNAWIGEKKFDKMRGIEAEIICTHFLPLPPIGQTGISLTEGSNIRIGICFGIPDEGTLVQSDMDSLWLFRGLAHFATEGLLKKVNVERLHQRIVASANSEMVHGLHLKEARAFVQMIHRVVQTHVFEDPTQDQVIFAYLRGAGYLHIPDLVRMLRKSDRALPIEEAVFEAFITLGVNWSNAVENNLRFDDPLLSCFRKYWLDGMTLVLPAAWREDEYPRILAKSLIRERCLKQGCTHLVRFDDEIDQQYLDQNSCWIISKGNENRFLPISTSGLIQKYEQVIRLEGEEPVDFQVSFLEPNKHNPQKWRLITWCDSLDGLVSLVNVLPVLSEKSCATRRGVSTVFYADVTANLEGWDK